MLDVVLYTDTPIAVVVILHKTNFNPIGMASWQETEAVVNVLLAAKPKSPFQPTLLLDIVGYFVKGWIAACTDRLI